MARARARESMMQTMSRSTLKSDRNHAENIHNAHSLKAKTKKQERGEQSPNIKIEKLHLPCSDQAKASKEQRVFFSKNPKQIGNTLRTFELIVLCEDRAGYSNPKDEQAYGERSR
jgi:hypothetical protein